MFCVEAIWHDEAAVELDPELGERAAYPLVGELHLPTEERALQRGEFAIFADGVPGKLRGRTGARALLLGGRARDWDLHMHWNFVASSPERILAARQRWADGEFPRVVGDDDAPVPDPAGRPR